MRSRCTWLVLGLLGLAWLGACNDGRRGHGGGGGGGGEGEGEGEGEVPPGCEGVDCGEHGRCATAGGNPVCICDPDWHADGLSCRPDNPCVEIDCDGHGTCELRGGAPYCDCEEGYRTQGANCVSTDDPCDGQECSGHGRCIDWGEEGGIVCACDPGFTPPNRIGLECVATETLCVGGVIDYDVDGDGENENWFEPNELECEIFELLNLTRATHDPEGQPECHHPLMWSVEWAAHGRNHSKLMQERGSLYHDDVPGGQNCAYGCDPACEMDMYMNGPNEPHCPELSHHCNIMRCTFTYVGIGTYGGSWNTQNFH